MNQELFIQNSLSRQKEKFVPIEDGFIGMYVCGPTVYSDVHLGNCRTFVSFDVMYRYLLHLGFKVRYVRNITDVGHLTDDADAGEDKIGKRAKQEKLEPMEVVQKYTNGFHDMMKIFNTKNPSIEPRATGHIMEQIKMVEDILANGLAYERNGSVYFDTIKFASSHEEYGKLSGRVIDELMGESRSDLKNQDEKNHPSDFAIWMKADDTHLMKWESPWSVGFPGWHLECSAMSTKYLGTQFDIHGGGNDLKFPHHENEIAQNVGACNCSPARYWIHTNMLLMNGRKMSKSDNNSITPDQLFTGDSEHISKSYSPMIVKFFMLQSHYASTLDLTDGALLAAEKGYKRIMEANRYLQGLTNGGSGNAELESKINELVSQAEADMNDDFNTPKSLSRFFELVPIINSHKDAKDGFSDISIETIKHLQKSFSTYLFDIFGLQDEFETEGNVIADKFSGLMDLIIDIRKDARTDKNWSTSDKIRDKLTELDIQLKDGKEGTHWTLN